MTRSSAGRCSGGASSRRRRPAAHWSDAVSKGTAPRVVRRLATSATAGRQSLDDVGALAGRDHPQAPRLALERRGAPEIVAARPQPLVLHPQRGDLVALVPRFGPGRDPRSGGADVEVDHEAEHEQQRPAAEAVPADAGVGAHRLSLRRDDGFACPPSSRSLATTRLRRRYARKTVRPGYSASPPSASSMRSSWLYFATRSERDGAPVLIWPQPVATARSAIVVSSVSPERCDITAV